MTDVTVTGRNGSRAFGPCSRRTPVVLLVVVALAAVVGLTAWRLSSNGSGSARYGGLPSWLRRAKVDVGRVVTASAAHPRLAIEGDEVAVRLPHGRLQATAVGPVVPEDGAFPVPATSPCTFTVTLAKASGTVPLRAAAFTVLDERGNLHHPQVSLRGGGTLPAAIPPGGRVVLRVHDVLPTGNGQLRWSPGGGKPVVSWDFDVEID